tara:strand:- start:2770 stop:2922 length:153 start_codon:yes stop_codon:yes gene_type:complete
MLSAINLQNTVVNRLTMEQLIELDDLLAMEHRARDKEQVCGVLYYLFIYY